MDRNCQSLKTIIEGWGGQLIEVADGVISEQRERFSVAPFIPDHRLGIFWKKKKILWSLELDWVSLIHEMGHIFACDEEPDNSEEFQFFGWEWSIARSIRGSMAYWWARNKDYCIDFGHAYMVEDLTPLDRRALIRDRLTVAKKDGILDAAGKPLAIR